MGDFFRFLYNYNYCSELPVNIGFEKFKDNVEKLVGENWESEFKKARDNHLFEKGNVSKKIIDYITEEYL